MEYLDITDLGQQKFLLDFKKVMRTKIIAEIGINHDGSFKKAIKLIDSAKKAGADIVKFQIFEPELLATSYAKKAVYQKTNSRDSEKQISMLKKYMLSHNEHLKLFKHCF